MATKTSARKAPQDHKQAERPVEETPGWDLLTPIAELTAARQAIVLAKATETGAFSDGASEEDMDFAKLAEVIEYFSAEVAVDSAKFDKWSSGKGGFVRTTELLGAFLGELGKDAS